MYESGAARHSGQDVAVGGENGKRGRGGYDGERKAKLLQMIFTI
jgi:hypothetical protein